MPSYYTASMPNSPGIYKINCVPTGRFYIGSAVNLRVRRKCHFGYLQRNEHRNPKLQSAFNKYGPDAFTFEIIELVLLPELLIAREQYFFDTLQPFDKRGFNLDRIAGSSMGRVMSQASREKSRATQVGRPSPNIGRKHTPEQTERQRQSLTGYKHSEEAKRNMGKAREGKKHSPATCEKIRLASLGHAPNNARIYILTSPDDVEYVVYGLRPFCKERGINSATLVQVAKGKRKHYKGWKARYPD